ncbi:inward rectifier potassium channel 16-like [Esox lucius]|uniref:Potassium inwardly rectifying channel subfamily J member 16 n=1 Tax=Esox lucius TaxID=8010 RepID=A0A3P9A296_ESOLU|nr:inward rectifier potassium channel 16-like [Esox lucius]
MNATAAFVKMSPGMDQQQCIIDTHHSTINAVGKEEPGQGEGQKRLQYMLKDGSCPVVFRQSPGEWSLFLVDIFTTLVEIRWRAMFLIFCLSYILSWLFFSLLYLLIAYIHKDLEDPDTDPCVQNVRSFTSAFLFSMETQATIGYGFHVMTENCLVAIAVVTMQDLTSCFINTVIIGITVAKMACARKRAQTVGFSSCAVVHPRNNALCLEWRIGDFRGNHILEGTARAQVICPVTHPSGVISVTYQDLDIENRNLILVTPASVVHKLEPGSPLYSLGPEGMTQGDFELVVSFTYTGDSTGILHQTRTSYTLGDIRWGQRFQDMVWLGRRRYKVDYARFNQTTWEQTPMVSAEEIDRRRSVAPTAVSVIRSQQLFSRSSRTFLRSLTDVAEEVIQEASL